MLRTDRDNNRDRKPQRAEADSRQRRRARRSAARGTPTPTAPAGTTTVKRRQARMAAPLAALALLIAFDPLSCAPIQATLSTHGTVQACAGGAGMVLNSHDMLLQVVRAFRSCKLLANLDVAIQHCTLAPLVSDHLGATARLRSWLA